MSGDPRLDAAKRMGRIFSRIRLREFIPEICFIAFAVFTFLIFSPELLKKMGDTLLFVPEKMGLVQRVRPDEVRSLKLVAGKVIIQRFEPGKYLIYTNDTQLFLALETRARGTDEEEQPWLTVRSADDSLSRHSVMSVIRGLRLYDTPQAEGRPILRFDIDKTGDYEIRYGLTRFGAAVSVVPDRASGKEWRIAWLSLIQIAVVLGPFCAYFARRWKKAIASRRRLQKEQRHRGEELMDLFRNRRSEE
jgi:hypothetical protein